MEYGGKKKKEGIYSPITQNQRHLELMKKIKVDNKNNIITKFMIGRYFEDCYKSLVVLANPKTVLNAKFAKKEVKDKVIRVDQLVKYIKEKYAASKEPVDSDSRMMEWAQSFLKLLKEIQKDYTEKYDEYKIDTISIDNPPKNTGSKEVLPSQELILSQEVASSQNEITSIEETEIFKELRAYRLRKSREENIKPYFIYNDIQLKDLISRMPRNSDELQLVAGFGEKKVFKYGSDILKIVEKY